MRAPPFHIVVILGLLFGVQDARSNEKVDLEPPSLISDALTPAIEDRLFRTADAGVSVIDLHSGEEVFSHQADQAFVPASTTKIITAAAALETLGPAYQFSTHIYRSGEITPEGVLEGDLIVKGFGDPSLVVEQLWRMVRDLRLEGIAEIDGNVIFDDDYFDDVWLIPGWDKDVDLANGPAYFAPMGALTLNYNTACLVVGPGISDGAPARVELDTPNAVVLVESEVVTGPPGSRSWLKIEREVDEKARTVTFTLEGKVPLDADVKRHYRTVGEPVAHFMAVFADLVKDQGIKVHGRYLDGSGPEEGTPAADDLDLVTRSDSEPLAALMFRLNKRSNNLVAEHILKAMGAEAYGVPGTTAKGLKVLEDFLEELGVPADEINLVNGSGLSRDMTLQPSHLTAVLRHMYHHRRYGPEFASSLAIGGVDGTLWRRFREPDEVGRMRGKTGSINGVHCLAGIVEGGDGRMYGFAFMVNGLRGGSWQAKKVHDQFVRGLLHLSDAPPDEPAEAVAAEG